MRGLLYLFTAVTAVLAASRTSPPSGALVVSKSPSSGQYGTIQAAVNALSTTSTSAQSIFIYQGTYNEQVKIPARKAVLTIYGYTTDTTTYGSNTVTITYSLGADAAGNNELSATVQSRSVGLKLYNLIIKNTRGKGVQALAISAYASKQGYYGCTFVGYQDTVLAQEGYQVYGKCYIEGATDFIWGQNARAVFSQCVIRVSGDGYVTANGRDSTSNPSYYLIDKSSIGAASSYTGVGKSYLGRPWRNYARVVVQRTVISNVINGAGWVQWSSSTPNTDHVTFQEYGNTGDGASGTRASFSSKLSAAVSPSTVLDGDTSWVDLTYVYQ
ncbi:Pectinesterase [Dactylellina cionopaga]|nr:Pectinesterase [Dactylellina cionopaga]